VKAPHRFRATLTAHSGDELVDELLAAKTGTGPATSENCVVFMGGSASPGSAPIGSRLGG
jgi:hypothetical protein